MKLNQIIYTSIKNTMEHIRWIHSSLVEKLKNESEPEKRFARETNIAKRPDTNILRTGKIEIEGDDIVTELETDLARTRRLFEEKRPGKPLTTHLIFVDLILNPRPIVSTRDNVSCLRFRIIGRSHLFLKAKVSYTVGSQIYNNESYHSFDTNVDYFKSSFIALDPSTQKAYVSSERDKERTSILESMLSKHAAARITEIMSTDRVLRQFSYLDLGCGDMSITNSIADRYLPDQTFGVDVFNHPNEGKFTYGASTPHYVNAKNYLPFLNNMFSLITCFVSIHHFEDLYTSLKELTRCAKIGALLFIREHNVTNQATADYLELVHFIDEILREKKGLPDDYFSRYNRKETLVKILGFFGWEEIGTESYDADKNPQMIYHSLFILKERPEPRLVEGEREDILFIANASKEWERRRPIINHLPDRATLVKLTKKRLLYAPWTAQGRQFSDKDILNAYASSSDNETARRLVNLFSGNV